MVGLGVYRWGAKFAPQTRPQSQPIDVVKVKQEIDQAKADQAKAAPADIPLLIGTNAATLVSRSGIPAVTGVSDYSKATKDGKLVVEFPINVWPGWTPIIMANAGMDPSDQSVFFKKFGFYVRLIILTAPVNAPDLSSSAHT